jgi:hypothetical protein
LQLQLQRRGYGSSRKGRQQGGDKCIHFHAQALNAAALSALYLTEIVELTGGARRVFAAA